MGGTAEPSVRLTIEIVFFDVGETLLRPYPSFADLFARVCKQHGHDVAPGAVRAVQERIAPHLVDLAHDTGIESPSLSSRESEVFWKHLYRAFMAELGMNDDSVTESLYEVMTDVSTYKLFDDVVPTLSKLEASGFRLGVISNFERWLEKVLVEVELGETFDVSVISGVEGIEKPDRRIYEIALERAGVDGSRAMHVGDSIKLDIEPATSVGLNVVLLDRAGRYPGADVPRISSLTELPGLLS